MPDEVRNSDPTPVSAPSASGSTAETAKAEASTVAGQATDSAGHVVDVAKSEAGDVVAEAAQNARQLWGQVRGEVTDQAGTQHKRVAAGLQDLADELGRMGDSAGSSGLAASFVQQASDRARSAGQWMEDREPGDLVTEAQRFASRKPGTFLAAAAALGFLGARLTRGLAAGPPSTGTGTSAGVTAVGSTDDGPTPAPTTVTASGEANLPTVTTTSHGLPVSYTPGPANLGTGLPEVAPEADITGGRL